MTTTRDQLTIEQLERLPREVYPIVKFIIMKDEQESGPKSFQEKTKLLLDNMPYLEYPYEVEFLLIKLGEKPDDYKS